MRYVTSLITVFALAASLAASTPAQRRRGKRPAAPAVTAEKIRRDIVGKSVHASLSDGSSKTRWTLAADELKEIRIKESETKGFITYVNVHMHTGEEQVLDEDQHLRECCSTLPNLAYFLDVELELV